MLGTNCETTADAPPNTEPTPLTRTYVWEDVTPTTAVVETTAEAIGCDPLDLDPLGYAIDTDALNTVAAQTTDQSPGNLQVSFSYHGYLVVVQQTGEVTLYDPEN